MLVSRPWCVSVWGTLSVAFGARCGAARARSTVFLNKFSLFSSLKTLKRNSWAPYCSFDTSGCFMITHRWLQQSDAFCKTFSCFRYETGILILQIFYANPWFACFGMNWSIATRTYLFDSFDIFWFPRNRVECIHWAPETRILYPNQPWRKAGSNFLHLQLLKFCGILPLLKPRSKECKGT